MLSIYRHMFFCARGGVSYFHEIREQLFYGTYIRVVLLHSIWSVFFMRDKQFFGGVYRSTVDPPLFAIIVIITMMYHIFFIYFFDKDGKSS